jgi:hypothetical protein
MECSGSGGGNETKGEIINARGYHHGLRNSRTTHNFGGLMAKGIQTANKMVKKPKKDAAPSKPVSSDRPVAPMTAVLPKGKLKNKPG